MARRGRGRQGAQMKLAMGLGLGGLLLSEWFSRRVRRMLGR